MTMMGGDSGQPTIMEEVFWQMLLDEREAAINLLRQKEDLLIAAGRIRRRAVITGPQMKRLEQAFGREEVERVLGNGT
jgi:hypothetical protein